MDERPILAAVPDPPKSGMAVRRGKGQLTDDRQRPLMTALHGGEGKALLTEALVVVRRVCLDPSQPYAVRRASELFLRIAERELGADRLQALPVQQDRSG